MIVEGKHTFKLRSAEPAADKDSVYALNAELLVDPESYILVNYVGGLPAKEEFDRRASGWNVYPYFLELAFDGDTLAGYAGARIGPSLGPTVQPHECEIHYAVKKQYRGSGVIYALLLSLLRRVETKYVSAYVFPGNQRSVKLLEKLGLNRVALIEEAAYHAPTKKYHDLALYRGLRATLLEKAEAKLREHGYRVAQT